MYRLLVFYAGNANPHSSLRVTNSEEVLAAIAALSREHPDCERIDVMMDYHRLFSVEGQRATPEQHAQIEPNAT